MAFFGFFRVFLIKILTLVLVFSLFATPAFCIDSDDSQIFISGFNAYQKKDYQAAIDKMTQVLQKYPDTPLRDMALFWLARAYFKAGKQQEAVKYMSQFFKEYPDSPLRSTVEDELLKLMASGAKPQEKTAEEKAAEDKAVADKVAAENARKAVAEKVEAKKRAAEQLAAEKAAADKAAAEKAATEKAAALKAAADKAAADKAAAEKAAAEKAAAEKAAAEKAAAEKAAAEKVAAEKAAALKAAADKAAAEKAAAEKVAAEKAAALKAAADKAATEKAAADKAAVLKAAAEKVAAEKAAAEKAAALKAATDKAAAEKAAAEKAAADKAAADKAAAEKAAAEKAAADKAAADKAAAEKVAAEKVAAEKVAAEKAAALKAATDKAAAERVAVEIASAQKAAAEKVAAEKAAAERAAAERATAERATAERATAERATAERATAERATAERVAAERAAAERAAAEKSAAEKSAAERAAAERAAAERAAAEKTATAKVPAERAAAEKAAAEKAAAEKAAAERAAAERAAAERAAAERAAAERAAAEKAATEKAATEKAATEKAATEKAAAPKATAVPKKEASPEAAALRERAVAEFKKVMDRFPGTKAAAAAAEQLRRLGIEYRGVPSEQQKPEAKSGPTTHILTMEVGQFADLDFAVLPLSQVYEVGNRYRIPFQIINKGNGSDSFILDAGFPSEFKAQFSAAGSSASIQATPVLMPDEKFNGELALTIPKTFIDGFKIVYPIRSESKYSPEVSESREIRVVASAPLVRAVVKAEKVLLLPGEKNSYKVAVLNLGSSAGEGLNIRLSYPPQYEPVDVAKTGFRQEGAETLVLESVRMNSGESREFDFSFRLKNDAIAQQELLVAVEVANPGLDRSDAFVSPSSYVQGISGVTARITTEKRTAIPGQILSIPITVTNTGNMREHVALNASVPLKTSYTFYHDLNRDGIRQANEPLVNNVGPLSPREEASVVMEVATPSNAADNSDATITIVFEPETDKGKSVAVTAAYRYSRPIVELSMAGKGGRLKPGEVSSFDLIFVNKGSNLAKKVELQSELPENIEMVVADPAAKELKKGQYSWTFDTIGAGEKRTVKVNFRVRSGIAVGTNIKVRNVLTYQDQLGNRY